MPKFAKVNYLKEDSSYSCIMIHTNDLPAHLVHGDYVPGTVAIPRIAGYIVHLRVQHACRQLLESTIPVRRVAYESGFGHPDRIRHAIREHIGVAPSAYAGSSPGPEITFRPVFQVFARRFPFRCGWHGV